MQPMWSDSDIPDQSGHLAVVTGGNGGLGLEVVRHLARRGATVVMAAHNQDKAQAARAAVIADVPDAAIDVRELDLASLASVRACADAIAAEMTVISARSARKIVRAWVSRPTSAESTSGDRCSMRVDS